VTKILKSNIFLSTIVHIGPREENTFNSNIGH